MPTHTTRDHASRSFTPRALARVAARLHAELAPTPTVFCPALAAHLKLENLQVTGAFKVRGALNAVATALARGDRREPIAASAGNHGLGVAWAARRLGLRCTIVVPRGAPRTKVDGCRRLGARVVEGGAGFDDCLRTAEAIAHRRGLRLVHAFDDPDVVAGQGSVGVELAALAPDVVLVPIGGGGLAAGVAAALAPSGVRVVGVQVAGVDAFARALAGEPTRPPAATIADGLRVTRAGVLTTALGARWLDDVVIVSEAEVRAAVAALAFEHKCVVEGAGAVAVAALPYVRGRRRVAIVSGGNIDRAAFTAAVTPRRRAA